MRNVRRTLTETRDRGGSRKDEEERRFFGGKGWHRPTETAASALAHYRRAETHFPGEKRVALFHRRSRRGPFQSRSSFDPFPSPPSPPFGCFRWKMFTPRSRITNARARARD